ncbi:MAG: nitroreductase family protein [Eubacteriales bacterium]|nr:nitroreductase family protein [Eubacteriales bacterium]
MGESTAAYINVGYVLEKADLYLQSIGLGSLWLGMAKPKENKQDFCIMLAFGHTSVPVRSSVEEFNRLPLAKISDNDLDIAKAARLAPSAVNSQPWKLHFQDGSVTIRYFGRGMMKLILKNRLNKIDLGICTRFVVEALKNEGKHIKAIIPKASGKELEIEVKYQ